MVQASVAEVSAAFVGTTQAPAAAATTPAPASAATTDADVAPGASVVTTDGCT